MSRPATSESESEAPYDAAIPLCVDLDGTLVLTDILHESLLHICHRPLALLRAAVSLLSGKAAMKERLAGSVRIEPSILPYREELMAFLDEQRRRGRRLLLVTATHRSIADSIARHLGIFSGIMATDGRTNLSGQAKKDALVAAFGEGGYDYIGDSHRDIKSFASARLSYLADPSRSLAKKARAKARVAGIFRRKRNAILIAARCVRAHQWTKNILLAVPLVAAHRLLDGEALLKLCLAFACFSFQASATYIINDLHDLSADRLHPEKRFRPLAHGDISIPAGIALALALSASAIALAISFLPIAFSYALVAYTAITLAYSFDLKKRLIVDALVLALLYTARIIAGAIAISVKASEWLLIFSLFFFLSLALLKRFIELEDSAKEKLSGRGYAATDIEVILSIGPTAGLLSVLVLALYIASPSVQILYRTPEVLWLLCPLLIYWITRIWFLAKRGMVHHDPIVFAVMDARSYVVAAVFAILLLMATLDLRRLLERP